MEQTIAQLETDYTKIENTVTSLSKGLYDTQTEAQNKKVVGEIKELKNKIKNKEIELEVYQQLKEKEGAGSMTRVHEIDRYLDLLREKESALQRTYRAIKNQIEDLIDNELEEDED